MNSALYLDCYFDGVDDDVCILPLITANDNSVIAKEVTLEGDYLPPALELPFADFGLLEQDEHLRSSAKESGEQLPEQLRNTVELRCKDVQAGPLDSFSSCKMCTAHFRCRSQWMRHQLLRHGSETLESKHTPRTGHRCGLCREKFPSVHQLAQHLNAQHPQCGVCNLCLTTFHDEATLEWHRKHHFFAIDKKADDRSTDRYVCDVCRKRCASSSHLHLHRKVHLEQKPYSCGHCDRAFSSSGNRQKHIARVHTHEKRYRCTKCEESFIYPRQLKLHRERNHGSDGENALSEEFLPYRDIYSITGATCWDHRKIEHPDELRAFECGHCAKRFKQATHLRNHLLTHTGVRAYGCDFCGKRFAMAGDLRVHRRIHTKEKPFRCERCPAAFIMGKQLNKHRSTAHGQEVNC